MKTKIRFVKLSIKNESFGQVLTLKHFNKNTILGDWSASISGWMDYYSYSSNARHEFGHSYPIIFLFRSLSKKLS